MPTEPYHVFAASWPGPNACGMSLSTSNTGALTGILDTWSYVNTSGIHGLALSPPPTTPQNNNTTARQLLYSADLNGDLLWTHTIDPVTGRATEASRWPMTAAGMHPRHLAVHPNGARLYAVMEADNSVAEYVLDASTGAVLRERVRHMLIPIDADTAEYWSAEVMLSSSGGGGGPRYLWATARGKGNDTTGFVSVFLLGDDGGIVKRMFRVPTTTGGGMANAISPAFWGDEYAAMTDYPNGYVLMWKMEGRRERGDGLVEYTTARAVARVDVGDGGCCANAIWYS